MNGPHLESEEHRSRLELRLLKFPHIQSPAVRRGLGAGVVNAECPAPWRRLTASDWTRRHPRGRLTYGRCPGKHTHDSGCKVEILKH